ncbi:MAG: hypothetical protein EXS37_05905 [Opitutus sp.]|nr:hypothetical protein [Opitutus sp.]
MAKTRGSFWFLMLAAVVVTVGFFSRTRLADRGAGVWVSSPRGLLPPANPGRLGQPPPPRSADELKAEFRALFTYARPPNAAALDAALPAPTREFHYVRVNTALILGKQSPFWQQPGAGRIELPLPDGTAISIVIDGSELLGPDRFTSVGRLEGRPQSRAVFAWHAGFLHASIADPLLGNFALRAATEEFSQFYKIDPALVLPCGGERRPRMEGAVSAVGSDSGPTFARALSAAAVENPQRAEVHVMMAYTRSVLPTLVGAARVAALQSAFDLAIATTNVAFEASLITARVKLVRLIEIFYDEDLSSSAKVLDDALTALYKTADGKMDELHAARDESGADIVCLALNRRDATISGLSFLLDERDEPESLENSRFAFSVVQYSEVAGTNTVTHELGHVFGCAHDRENARSGQGAYPYSYGYRFFGADGRLYHDIMSYSPGTELGFFSNPDVIVPSPVNAPIGIAAGRPGESNTALTIEQNAFATAMFRLQTQTAPGAGTLLNVATRAFVGTGDQVLIGGFVIQGPQPKELLIRAAGPALAAFGVSRALGDPIVRIFSGGTLTAENDNWSLPIGAGRPATPVAIAAAAARINAFPFVAGSADAAILITLPPGAYSAVMEGARGTTGFGLIEAYEVGQDAGRIVALATRGYADRSGKEMYAGFVVQGVPGTTKRLLVRVLGPTLGRSPFNLPEVLDDPEMEIRNAAGDTVIRSDDWTTTPEIGGTPETDFTPEVEVYRAKQIFATGHAPGNRREPCVLVDLPPGTYHVVVRPFERRDPNPNLDQPAKPGLGVVEVYEIAR